MLATIAASFVANVAPVQAATNTSITASIPSNTTTVQVGQTNLPSTLRLSNQNDGPNAGESNIIDQIVVTPSCGGGPPFGANPPCANPDPGVFVLSSTGTGRVGTVCAGKTFTIAPLNDATGSYTFTPVGGPVVLAPSTDPVNSVCIVDYTANVVKGPTLDAQPGTPGTQTFVNALTAFHTTAGNNGTGTGSQIDTLLGATATLSTQASTNATNVQPGASVTDAATVAGVAGSPVPTGTVTYTLVGPGPNATCTAPIVGSNTKPVGSASDPFVVTTPGTYNFVATYSGDANYAPVTTPVGCGVGGEMFTVAQLPITLTTQASTNGIAVAPGTAVTDQAALTPPAGGPAPTGTITYTLVGPGPNATCTGPVFGVPSTVPVGAPSTPLNPTAPGLYNFVATYSGDVNYAPITTPVGCGVPAEQFSIARQPVTLVTQSSTNSTTVAPGTSVTDTATVTPGVAGGPAPTGTVTYTLVGPNPNVSCSTPVVGSSTVPVGQPSAPFTPTAPGVYNFIATYSGDGVYAPITTPVGCGVPAEQFTVTLRPIGLSTQASNNSPTVAPGSTVTDTATFTPPAGGPAPTGTVTYTLVGPNPNATCTAPVAGPPNTQNVGTASTGYVVTAPGTYNFVATYSGDANYAAITTPVGCGDPNERFTVALQPAPLTTQASTNSTTVTPGSTVTDQATFTPPAGGPAATGTVTYTLVGPNPDATCAAPVVGTSTVAVGSPSSPFIVTSPGAYNFVATYSGDAFYAPVTTPVGCGVAGERFAVATQPVNLTTQASTNSTTVPPGTTVTDVAALGVPAGSPAPTGTVTYTLVGPNPNATCTAPVVGAPSTVAVGQPSGPFTVTGIGTYNFVATYSGDANYAPITTPVGCGVPAEMFTVAPRPIGLTTTASTNSRTVAPGAPVADTAAFTPPPGGPAPTGTVTYTLVGPNPNATCTTPVFGTPATAAVGAASPPFSPTAPGTYNFVATYSGDANYAAVTTPVGCGDPNEIFAIALQPVNLATQASTNAPNVTPGSTVTDQATLTPGPGGPAPTGTVTYTLVGPNPDPTCAGPAVGTASTVPAGAASGPFTVTAPGTYNFLATYSGDAFYAPITTPVGCNVGAERLTVVRAPVTIVTQASPAVPVGGTITDTATLSGGTAPTGTITFTLFGPDNATCTGTPIFTSTVPVNNGNGNYTSGAFTTAAAGAYRWVATYSGDANNAPAGPTACADPAETTAGNRATPTLVTTASAGSVGSSVSDTATLSNGFNPTGTITFRLFNNDTCTGTPVFTSTKPVTGNGNVLSDTFILPAPGVYHFVATYSGDANNVPLGPTACLDPNEAIGVGRKAISLSTRASDPVTVGNAISDTATIANAFNPTGTVTFTLFGPDNATCTGTPVFTSTKPVNGNGTYPSDSFTPSAPGVYRWIATYSGDANNASAATPCGDPLEQVTVNALPTIAITKAANPTSLPVPGGTFTFNVVVTNTSNEALTIRSLTDNIYGDITTLPGSTCNTAIGTVLAPSPGPGNTYSCHFQGDFRGAAGASQTDTVTVTATDTRGNTVHASANATVTLTPVPPSITTTKSAAPPSLQEPGGTFTFSYSVTNTGPEPVTITSIVDNVYGDLNGRGTCAVGARLAPNGGTYSCTFTGNFFGDAGASQTDTITTIGRNDRGQEVVSKASATVTLTNVPPSIQIIKTPDPTSRPEPGGSFRFTVTVTNTSFEPITTTSLVDNIYGDLNGRGSCAIGVVLAPNGGRYSCAFDGNFFGKAGDAQTDTVTVVAVDNEGTPVTAKASATVTLTPVNTPVVPPPPPPPPVVVTPPPVVITPIVPVTVAPVQQVLVRTGANAMRQIRIAGLFLLVGMALVVVSMRFRGGPGLALAPSSSGPRPGPGDGGDGGSGGGGGGSRFDDGSGGGRSGPRPPTGGGGVARRRPPNRPPTDVTPTDVLDPAFLDIVARRPAPPVDTAPVEPDPVDVDVDVAPPAPPIEPDPVDFAPPAPPAEPDPVDFAPPAPPVDAPVPAPAVSVEAVPVDVAPPAEDRSEVPVDAGEPDEAAFLNLVVPPPAAEPAPAVEWAAAIEADQVLTPTVLPGRAGGNGLDAAALDAANAAPRRQQPETATPGRRSRRFGAR